MSEKHVVLPGSQRPRKQDATRLQDVDPNDHIEVTLNLRGPEMPGADDLPSHSLSPEEFTERYGASREDAERVVSAMERYGLKVEEVSLPTRSVRVSGAASAVEAAFPSNLGLYHSAEQGYFRGREGDIKIPAELQGIVTAVLGLDQRRVARRAAAPAGATKLAPLAPSDFERLYNFPPGDGAGQQIGIAEFGGGFFPDDLQAFCAKHNRPVPTVNLVTVNLAPLTLQDIQQLPPAQQNEAIDEAGEVMLDVEVIAGFCPAARINMYFARFDQKGWVDLLDRAITDRPVTLSVSWGLAEDSGDWSKAARDAINQRLAAAAALGITVCVASGDDGTGDELTDGRAHVDFPSVSPFVLCVGGTMLTGHPANATEQVWFEPPGRRTRKGGGATGGGVSVFIQRPQYQNVHVASLNPGSIDGRVVPDVAAVAGPPFYDIIFLGEDSPNGGTSASAPLWASLVARINAQLQPAKRQRFLTPLLYGPGTNGQPRGQTGCKDIQKGQNPSKPKPGVGYKATAGFDAVTGWGTPNGVALLESL